MKSCKECLCHLVCAIYAPHFNDIIANGGNCSGFIQDYKEIAKKLWTYICIIDNEKGVYEELADAIGLTDDELAYCRRLEQ